MQISEEQLRELMDESAQLGRACEAISAELFKQLARDSRPTAGQQWGHAAGAEGEQAGAEKRSTPRIGVHYTVTVRPIIPGIHVAATPFIASITDVSCDGVGLICPVAVHAQFTLEMPNENGIVFAITCSQRSMRKLDDDHWHVGATFDDPLDDAAPPAQTADQVDLANMLPRHPAMVPFDIFKDS